MKKVMIMVVCALFFQVSKGAVIDTIKLKPKPIYGREARVVSYILDNYHYRKLKFNDSLSAAILTKYIDGLDNTHIYLLASDVQSFDKYKFLLDDFTHKEDVTPAYAMYNVFVKRYHERMDYVFNTLLNAKNDYTIDEDYNSDREKAPWAKTTEELNEIWRKIVKNQALSLKLTGKTSEEITRTLKMRYERFCKTFNQEDDEDVFNIYMNSISEAYDPHTNYLSPKVSDLFNQTMSLSLEGIGAQLQSENEYTRVIKLMPGGDAFRSGKLHPDDFIIGVAQGVNGKMEDVVGWRLHEVVKLIKGPKGTVVRLQIMKANAGAARTTEEITLTRDKIKLEEMAAKKSLIHHNRKGKDMKLGVITLPEFYMDIAAYQKGDSNYRSTTRDVKKLIEELKTESIDGLVIDLRNNGGGSLMEAIDLTGLFIEDGPVVQVRSSNNQIQVQEDKDKSITYAGPLVVLTNRFSASASEIFAGAIQDYHRGIIVGESTFGKGTVQRLQELGPVLNEKNTPVGELKYTVQKFYRVTGSSTQHKGVEPDVKLPTALDDHQFGESAYLSAMPWDVIGQAIYHKTPDVTDKTISELNKTYNERVKNDPQLKKLIEATEESRKNLRQTSVSLNEAKRRKQMDEVENKKIGGKTNPKLLTNKEGLPQDELLKLDDEYLREGLLIVLELSLKKIG